MGEDVALHIGAADFTSVDLQWFAIPAFVAAGIALIPWARWHFREWRIRRAEARGDHEQAEIIALDREVGEPPRTLRQLAGDLVFMLVGVPALLIFQMNFADELEYMLGEGWGFASMMITMGFIFACSWAWGQVRRNALSPEELAALEEEEEHQRWMRSIDGDSMPGLLAALALGAGILAAIYFLIRAITPG